MWNFPGTESSGSDLNRDDTDKKMGLLSFMRIMKTGIPRSIIVSAFKKTGGTIIRIL